MNLIEAMKSGKRYRRKGETDWYDATDYYQELVFLTTQILADDWEVEEVRVSITRAVFFRAYADALKETGTTDTYHMGEVVHYLAERLGL